MIKALLFDLDNTLLDRDASVKKFVEVQYDRLTESVGHIPKTRYIERFIALDAHGYVWKDKVYSELVKEFNITRISADELLADYVHNFHHHCISFVGLYETLTELYRRGIRLGIITNGRTEFQLGNIRALGISHFFDVILVSEQEDMKKPDPRIFRKALRMLGAAAADSCFVGDHPINDVKAAQAVGMKGILKKTAQWDACETDYMIEELNQLTSLAEKFDAAILREEHEC